MKRDYERGRQREADQEEEKTDYCFLRDNRGQEGRRRWMIETGVHSKK